MKRLWFVMPVHGRQDLTGICLRQLRRTCDALDDWGIYATAVVIGDDENLETAYDLGFATAERDNGFLARKFNDGIQLACDAELNPEPAHYVVPIGSDDWVDHHIFRRLPTPEQVMAFRHVAFVNETATELTETRLAYEGGVGIRIYPRALLEPSLFRPADEDRKRACDTSILYNTRKAYKRAHGRDFFVRYGDRHPRQIVDWKTAGQQMNSYDTVAARHRGSQAGDPFELLKGIFPTDALEEMAAHYQAVLA